MAKYNKGTLTFGFPDGHTEKCRVEAKAKNGIQGFITELIKVMEGFRTQFSSNVVNKMELDYQGVFEDKINLYLSGARTLGKDWDRILFGDGSRKEE